MNADASADSALKRCSRCGVEQPREDFPWKHRARGLRRSWCHRCSQAYAHEHYLRNIEKYKKKARVNSGSDRKRIRALVDDYLSNHPCVDCGAADIAILEFDHRDPADKLEDIARLASNAGWATVLSEIVKCDVRCANCHRQRTARQFAWAKLTASSDHLPDPTPLAVVGRAPSDPSFLKACIWCIQLKPLSSFAFKDAATRALNSHCRTCQAAYRRQHYVDNRPEYFRRAIAQTRRKMREAKVRLHEYLLRHPCVDCGETHIATLDFDHVDPSTKEAAVAQLVGKRTWPSIQREIDNCVVRCANCHRRRTLSQRRAMAA